MAALVSSPGLPSAAGAASSRLSRCSPSMPHPPHPCNGAARYSQRVRTHDSHTFQSVYESYQASGSPSSGSGEVEREDADQPAWLALRPWRVLAERVDNRRTPVRWHGTYPLELVAVPRPYGTLRPLAVPHPYPHIPPLWPP